MKGKKQGEIICDTCGKSIGIFVVGSKNGGDYCSVKCAVSSTQEKP